MEERKEEFGCYKEDLRLPGGVWLVELSEKKEQ